MKIFSVIGKKGSGKSEVMTSLIACFKNSGLRVGVIKHIANDDVEIDQQGKDTFVYRAEGAQKVILSGRRRFAVFENLEEEKSFEDLQAGFRDYGVVLLEGYFAADFQKIEIHHEALGSMLAEKLENVIAVCTDSPSPRPLPLRGGEDKGEGSAIPIFGLDQINELANWLMQSLLSNV